MSRGAKLAVDSRPEGGLRERRVTQVSYESSEALERATVVIDCTPAGNQMKEKYYRHLDGPRGFIAQGSEEGFGKPYARGVNDEALVPGEDRFLQVVSCNTHNISTLIKTLCRRRRARTTRSIAASSSACDAPTTSPRPATSWPRRSVGKHDDPRVRHAPRARRPSGLPDPRRRTSNLFSSAVKLNTQYMHSIWFHLDARPRHHARGGHAAAAREPAGGDDRQAAGQPDLQLRPRSRLLRPHPFADRGGAADAARCATSARSTASASPRRTAIRFSRRSPRRCGWSSPGTATRVGRRLEPLRRWLYREI